MDSGVAVVGLSPASCNPRQTMIIVEYGSSVDQASNNDCLLVQELLSVHFNYLKPAVINS